MNAWKILGLWRYAAVAAFTISTALGDGYWVTHKGRATRYGIDDWTFVNSSVYAQLNHEQGVAKELEVTNFDSKYPIYISGVGTGTNQYSSRSGRTGQEVPPEKTVRFPITSYQTKGHPIEEMEFIYQYFQPYDTSMSEADKKYQNDKRQVVENKMRQREEASTALQSAQQRSKNIAQQFNNAADRALRKRSVPQQELRRLSRMNKHDTEAKTAVQNARDAALAAFSNGLDEEVRNDPPAETIQEPEPQEKSPITAEATHYPPRE